jgi:hypothetical protein
MLVLPRIVPPGDAKPRNARDAAGLWARRHTTIGRAERLVAISKTGWAQRRRIISSRH